jgi:hypothetical protein
MQRTTAIYAYIYRISTAYDPANPREHGNFRSSCFEPISGTSIERSLPIGSAIMHEHMALRCAELQIQQRHVLLLSKLEIHFAGAGLCLSMGRQ